MATTTPLLLDTQHFLWWQEANPRIAPQTIARIERATQVFVSAMTAVEIAVKVSIGKLRVPDTPFQEAITSAGFTSLPFAVHHAEVLRILPLHHRDPFDRMLVAQAIADGLVLVTSDATLSTYPVRTA
ncbi:MAG: type II toxin-antitoxin system VapC family toxin [Protaetiibacter sp.]